MHTCQNDFHSQQISKMAVSEPAKRLILEAATGEYQYEPRPLVQTPVMKEGWYRIFSNPNPPTRT